MIESGKEKPMLEHVGLNVYDLKTMVDFYSRIMGLRVTDRGMMSRINAEIVFMSSDPGVHHQLVLASGRPEAARPGAINQISFRVGSLSGLKEILHRLDSEGIETLDRMDHGNAWSIYFKDPEENVIEVYAKSPWHVPQPCRFDLDLDKSDDEIIAITAKRVKETPGYMPAEKREAEMRQRMARA